MEPLGSFEERTAPLAGALLLALAAVGATLLFELSRALARRYQGRWFAGNGRDVFHLGAAVVMAAALFACGLPPPLAFAVAGSAAMIPLLVLDSIEARRARLAAIFAAIAAVLLPTAVAPSAVVRAGNAAARALLPRGSVDK